MTRIRIISHIVLVALSMQVAPVLAARSATARRVGFWETVSGWFNQQVDQAEKAADTMGDRVEQAAQKVEDRVRDAAQKAKKRVEKNVREAGGMADRLVEPVVERVHQHVKRRIKPMIKDGVKHIEKHAKPAIERVVKSTLQEVEKQAQPAIERAEKRIQQNIGRTISEYSMAGLGGIVGFIAVRKAAVSMTSNNPGRFGSWVQEQDKGSSLVADVLIGGMIGMGIYGLTQSYQVESVSNQ